MTAVAVLAIAAAATVAIDIHNAQDTDNPHMGPGFPWVLRISSDEQAALRWLRVNAKPWDLVQVDAIERGPGSWAYIPAFGERRMAGGLTRMDAMQMGYMTMALRRQKSQELHMVERALAAIAEGTYGECQRCGEVTAPARLAARPAALLCVTCAEAQARRG